MKLTFLGTSHGKPEKNRYCTSTVLTVGGKHYVIDAGAPLVDLFQRYDLAFENIAALFVTHNHIDHIAGLPLLTATLNSAKRFFDVGFPVFVPELTPYHAMLEFVRGKRELYGRLAFTPYEAGKIFDDGTVRVTAIRTEHTEHSYAFHISAEGKSVVFTGDLRSHLSDYPEIIRTAHHDLVVMEAAHQHYDEPYVADVLAGSDTARMVIHHIAEHRNPLDVIRRTADTFHFPVEIAYDGMTLEI